jgi:hypothetical protein
VPHVNPLNFPPVVAPPSLVAFEISGIICFGTLVTGIIDQLLCCRCGIHRLAQRSFRVQLCDRFKSNSVVFALDTIWHRPVHFVEALALLTARPRNMSCVGSDHTTYRVKALPQQYEQEGISVSKPDVVVSHVVLDRAFFGSGATPLAL